MSVTPSDTAIDQEPHLRDADQNLLQRLAAGESGAFDQLVEEHRGYVARLVYRLLGWRGEVEDVVQEVFLVAYRKLAGFRGQSRISTWLAGIAVNRCRAHRRRWMPNWRWMERLWRRRRPAAGPIQPLVEDETAERVRAAVRGLSDPEREVIVLYYLEDLPVSQIAQLLGTSAGSIDVRLHRARQRLREALADVGEE